MFAFWTIEPTFSRLGKSMLAQAERLVVIVAAETITLRTYLGDG